MNKFTYIPNLPDELESVQKEVSKLFQGFAHIITYLLNYFETTMIDYEKYHAERIIGSNYENRHIIDINELLKLDKTIKKYKNILSTVSLLE